MDPTTYTWSEGATHREGAGWAIRVEGVRPVSDGQVWRRAALCGDFNILAGMPASKEPHPGHQVLEEIKSYGLIECLVQGLDSNRYLDPVRRADMDYCRCGLREACTHTRTYYRRAHPHVPYQDHYLFASPALAGDERLLTSLAQRVGPDSPSDHAPIIAVFDV